MERHETEAAAAVEDGDADITSLTRERRERRKEME